MITLINSGTKYHYKSLKEAATAARSQAQVRQVLEQAQPELEKVKGKYNWSLQEVYTHRPKRRGITTYFIQAKCGKDTWRDSMEFDTPKKALANFLGLMIA